MTNIQRITNVKKHLLNMAVLGCMLAATTIAQAEDCKPAHEFNTVVPGKLTATFYDYAPYTSADQNGQTSGIDIEILRVIAKENCLELDASIVDPAATIQSVVTGKADIAVGGWNRTEKRAQVVGISNPINLAPMGIWSKDGTNTVEGLLDRKLGTVSGYMWVEEVRKMSGPNLNLYPNRVALHQDLQSGRVEVALDGYIAGTYAQTKGAFPDLKIEMVTTPDERIQASVYPPQTGILYTKENEALGTAINAVVADLKKSGKIRELLVSFGLDAALAETGDARLVK